MPLQYNCPNCQALCAAGTDGPASVISCAGCGRGFSAGSVTPLAPAAGDTGPLPAAGGGGTLPVAEIEADFRVPGPAVVPDQRREPVTLARRVRE